MEFVWDGFSQGSLLFPFFFSFSFSFFFSFPFPQKQLLKTSVFRLMCVISMRREKVRCCDAAYVTRISGKSSIPHHSLVCVPSKEGAYEFTENPTMPDTKTGRWLLGAGSCHCPGRPCLPLYGLPSYQWVSIYCHHQQRSSTRTEGRFPSYHTWGGKCLSLSPVIFFGFFYVRRRQRLKLAPENRTNSSFNVNVWILQLLVILDTFLSHRYYGIL